MTSRILNRPVLRRIAIELDVLAGRASIAGVVTINGLPSVRRVRLYDKPSGALLTATLSAADGSYRFDRLREGHEYFVVADDYQRSYNAVVQDLIIAEVL